MSDTELPDSFADEIPVADAVEQVRTAADEPPSVPDEEAPLESDPSDWQEQRLMVEDPDEEFGGLASPALGVQGGCKGGRTEGGG